MAMQDEEEKKKQEFITPTKFYAMNERKKQPIRNVITFLFFSLATPSDVYVEMFMFFDYDI